MKKIFGVGREHMSDTNFLFMAFGYKLREIFYPNDKFLETLGIKEGMTVIDYGCGPGSYIKKTSELVGQKGKVCAVDIHKLAINAVNERIKKYNLKNVAPVLVESYFCPLDDQIADIIFAFDVFHMIENPTAFLRELHRLLKSEGHLIIDKGHQSPDEAKTKIGNANIWQIESENRKYFKCRPLHSQSVQAGYPSEDDANFETVKTLPDSESKDVQTRISSP
jgi:ubiquinone/menaquinone biosynthesis C-methylase UbiE